jgi:hypothetical protein
VYRKAMQFLAVTLVLSALAISCELTVLASVRAPAHPLLQATDALAGAPAATHRVANPLAAAGDGPSTLVNCKAAAEWAPPAARALTQPVPQPKISLGQVTVLTPAPAPGAYANRTAPTGFDSALAGVKLPSRSQAPTLLLAALMLVAAAMVARHTSPVAAEEAPSVSGAPRRAWSRQAANQPQPRRPRLEPRILGFADLAADWERVRLVPT